MHTSFLCWLFLLRLYIRKNAPNKMATWVWLLILAIILIIIGLVIYYYSGTITTWVWIFGGLGVLLIILSIVFVFIDSPKSTVPAKPEIRIYEAIPVEE